MEGIEWSKIKEKGFWRQRNFERAQKKAKYSKINNAQPLNMNMYSEQSKTVKFEHFESVMKQKKNLSQSSKARGSEGFVSHPLQANNLKIFTKNVQN